MLPARAASTVTAQHAFSPIHSFIHFIVFFCALPYKEIFFEGTIKIFVHDKEELEVLVTRLKALHGIQTVDRFDAEAEN